MEDWITRAEHEEFKHRLEDANRRQDKRIELMEQNVEKIASLMTSVEKLATNMESMVREQERQGKRLEALEGRDGEMWRKVMGHIVTVIVGAVLGFILTRAGL